MSSGIYWNVFVKVFHHSIGLHNIFTLSPNQFCAGDIVKRKGPCEVTRLDISVMAWCHSTLNSKIYRMSKSQICHMEVWYYEGTIQTVNQTGHTTLSTFAGRLREPTGGEDRTRAVVSRGSGELEEQGGQSWGRLHWGHLHCLHGDQPLPGLDSQGERSPASSLMTRISTNINYISTNKF